MTHRPLWQYSARELADAIRSRSTTAREVIDAHLARIDVANPAVNALTVVFHDRARALADRVDAAFEAGEDPGPLAGVPFTVKENIDLTWSARDATHCLDRSATLSLAAKVSSRVTTRIITLSSRSATSVCE